MECPGSNEVCCQKSFVPETKPKTTTRCSDHADQGFQCVPSDQCSDLCEVITDGGGNVTVRGDSLGCNGDMECPGSNEVCCQKSSVPETKPKTTTRCSDHADQGFQCVPSDQCNEMCEIITDGSNLLDMRTQELGIDCSEKKCPGENQICCQRADMLDSVDITNPEYDGGRLEELESKVKGSLERVKEALEEVKGNEKAVSLLKNIHFTLESVLDKLSILMSQVPSQCLKGVFSLYKCLKS